MSYEIEGLLKVLDNTVQVSDKFKKREFVIEKSEDNNGQVWVDTIKFQAVQAKCELLDSFGIGEMIKVSFNIKGNKWEKNGKISYFNNLDAWKFEKLGAATEPDTFTPVAEGKDDLPF